MIAILLAIVFAVLPSGKPQVCQSTVFGQPGDKLAGGRTLAGPYPRDITGVAHRWAPIRRACRNLHRLPPELRADAVQKHCAKVLVCTSKKCAVLPVIDRGPYGKRPRYPVDKDDTWFNACPNAKKCPQRKRPGRWKGCLDLTPTAAELLEHGGGRERVKIWHIWRRRRSRTRN